jgi:hypothetical protein
MQKMGALIATTAVVAGAAADIGQQSIQELLPELLIVCVSHAAHSNQVPGLRMCLDAVSLPAIRAKFLSWLSFGAQILSLLFSCVQATSSIRLFPAYRADILIADAELVLPSTCG